ncbi:MAG: lamin tail domain-containing protein, partial [Planctomycetales bacterium]|nr:lamin tail domain-containing protein [Planctomycetales bacterium]
IVNKGSDPIDLSNIAVVNRGETESMHALGAGTLNPGEMMSVAAAELGFKPADNDFLGLYTSNKSQLLDAVRVSDRLQGRSDAHGGKWLYTSAASPGTSNQFAVSSDIVINEIMYHPHPELAIPDVPPQFDFTELIPFDAQWTYNATGARLAADWATQTYAVNGTDWLQGQGLLGAETSALAEPLNTEFPRPSSNNPAFYTYYFQTDFDLSADQLAAADTIQMNHIIDDGAIIYLNGQEIHRFNLPDDVDPDTTASSSVRNAELTTGITVPRELLQIGKNVLSAEVHTRNASDSDIVFGAQVVTGEQVTDLIPGTEFREKDEEEWIELYNKGQSAVDLSGWSLNDAIDYDFPDGTMIGAGEYLVVAKDSGYLSQKYPDIRIIGDYGGQLSDHDDRIMLMDPNDNPADEVHYYEGGQWPAYADGGGVSLELTDPNADNSKGTVWAASDDSSESEWTSHSFRGTALIDIFGAVRYHEMLFGLLGPGEFLIDDIEVVRDPGGAAVPLMQNGTFEADTVGEEPDKWRLIGNHTGIVVTDPTDANNKALHVVADGAMAYVHDHAETTFANDERIRDGVEYEISFRAKWVAGASQLNSRLWFNRLSNKMRMDLPDRSGTPGAQNTAYELNVGPVYGGLQHSPVTPAENEEVTVQIRAMDPDSVASMKLHWRKDRTDWTTVDMTMNDAGNYQAVIPGHESGDIVQFYVEGQDGQGAVSTFPAEGADSRALIQVDDGRGPRTQIDSFRMIMMSGDDRDMFINYNLMSNDLKGITLVHNNETVFYDVEARMIGSRFIRPNSGYKIELDPAQAFNGVHDSIRFDLDGLREIVVKQMINRTGGTKASQYDDIGYLLANNRGHSHEFLLQLARYESLYLNEQFENGSDGTKFEVDDVTVPSGGPAEGLKTGTDVNTGQDIGGTGNSWASQRDNPEFYRGHILIKSNRAKDDYASIVRLAQAIHLEGDELFQATNEVMDVDLWMRHYAHQSFLGAWDTYGFGRPKNLRIYVRPADDKLIPLMWDCDRCPMDAAIKQRIGVSRLDEIRDIPHNLRLYWGHMLDFMNTSFTQEYVAKWAAHYGALADGKSHGADGDFTEIVSKMRTRVPQAMSDMERDIPRVDFQITTNGGNDVQTDQPFIMLEGKGWVDIRHLRLAGTDEPFTDVFWPSEDVWQFTLPLSAGENAIAIEAIDYRGNLISTDTINVTSTIGVSAVDSLRITEVNYNPGDPTDAESAAGHDNSDDFEFIELRNTGDQTISLAGIELAEVQVDGNPEGVSFDFSNSAITELAPGAFALVVEDAAAFAMRYGDNLPVAGQWSGGLSNSSETITLRAAAAVIQQFKYDDGWHPSTDGDGNTLEIINENGALEAWGTAEGWRPSGTANGSPGAEGSGRVPGDSNGDGVFNSSDFVLAFQAGEYEDDIAGNSTFEEGDWDGDGDFTTSDFVYAFTFGNYVAEAKPVTTAAAVDESTKRRAELALQPVVIERDFRSIDGALVDNAFQDLDDDDDEFEFLI